MKAKFLTVFQILIFSSVFFLRGILSGRHSLRFYRIQNLYRQCGTIKAAVLNEGIIEIEDSALEDCVNLKSIRLCAGLKSIENSVLPEHRLNRWKFLKAVIL